MKHRNIIILISTLIIIVVISILLYFYWSSLAFFSVIVTDALWASVLATIVLVVINAFYLLQNRQTIREMEKARKAEFMPHVRAELSWLGSIFLVLKVTNFGKGPATNIKAEITFLPSNQKRPWNETILSPNETIRILLPDGNKDRVCDASADINVKGEYQDIFGQPYPILETIHVKEFINEATQLQPILESDTVGEIKNMNKEIHDAITEMRQIRYALEKIADFGNLTEVIEKATYELRRQYEDREKRET